MIRHLLKSRRWWDGAYREYPWGRTTIWRMLYPTDRHLRTSITFHAFDSKAVEMSRRRKLRLMKILRYKTIDDKPCSSQKQLK
jgi:hypothetical protein